MHVSASDLLIGRIVDKGEVSVGVQITLAGWRGGFSGGGWGDGGGLFAALCADGSGALSRQVGPITPDVDLSAVHAIRVLANLWDINANIKFYLWVGAFFL